ncbi:hypothetical protein CAOG_04937 [Capsaspora owczarzaki ATCC 30864]|uniref:TKL protein kinase n=1 Tax=Capsaspora owczarzaki (strain ATCC 30864) TaxID=595528 RepID=A0A0D2WS93_CAPO3|nr:hypothetical protein CAOG_04937 [Capsaspora owczarzaki ATCC 30864]KJE94268.1 TKL protein kinase [Capsaspora owczarzaki ATCC 30864]|eukprot:XP_004347688.2 hypothetical protein CAOG_04937 [Capsaspora owczarzaki ATCC 30864]
MSTADGFCHTLITWAPIGKIGLLSFVFAIIQFVTILVIVFWLHQQSRLALKGDSVAAARLILPFYMATLYAFAFADLFQGSISIGLSIEIDGPNAVPASILYGAGWGFYHIVLDGIAFFLMQQGGGTRAVIRACIAAVIWGGVITTTVHTFAYYLGETPLSLGLQLGWEFVTIVFYLVMALAPLSHVFRRPALFVYSVFWICERSMYVIAILLEYFEIDAGDCLSMFVLWVLFGCVKPLVVYRTLLHDSEYWQGLYQPAPVEDADIRRASAAPSNGPSMTQFPRDSITSYDPDAASVSIDEDRVSHYSGYQPYSSTWHDDTQSLGGGGEHNNKRASGTHNNSSVTGSQPDRNRASITQPLLGTSLSSHSARELAARVDELHKGVNIINYAFLSMDANHFIGMGGLSKVFRGELHGRPVAIKIVFCVDLTPAIISNFCRESALLSALNHPNIVKVEGVCIVPPSLCLVMELCDCSLFDRLRDSARPLDWFTRLRIATDCAKGIAFLHEQRILHMDLKSSNFLIGVDGLAKVSDFELSQRVPDRSHSGKSGRRATFKSNSPSLLQQQQQQQQQETHTDPASDAAAAASSSASASASSSSSSNAFSLYVDNVQVPETVNWSAPEVISSGMFTDRSDVYSLGMVLFEIVTGQVPYDDPLYRRPTANSGPSSLTNSGIFGSLPGSRVESLNDRTPLLQDVTTHASASSQPKWFDRLPRNNQYLALLICEQKLRPSIPSDCPPRFTALMQACWQHDAERRPTAFEVAAELQAMLEESAAQEPNLVPV